MYFTTIYLFLWIETTCRIHKHSCHKQHGPGSLDTFPPIWWLVSLAKYKITKRFRWNKIKTNTLFNVKILKNICICKLILLYFIYLFSLINGVICLNKNLDLCCTIVHVLVIIICIVDLPVHYYCLFSFGCFSPNAFYRFSMCLHCLWFGSQFSVSLLALFPYQCLDSIG